jgi:hypothetical protein
MPSSDEIEAAHLACLKIAQNIRFERRAGEDDWQTFKRCLREFLEVAIPAALQAAEETREDSKT